MELTALAGNQRLKEQLSQQQTGRGLAHAYLISGPQGSGRHTLARLLCQAMVCTAPQGDRPCGHCAPCKKVLGGIHPDVTTLAGSGEGKSITVDQIRSLRADAYVRPNEGERKVYILEGAGQMNASAQNAMLKLLEEGPAYAAFLLLAENGSGLLQTVRSRCEELSLSPLSVGECRSYLRARFPQKSEGEIERAALDCQGILGRAVEALGETDPALQARRELVGRLAQVMETGEELDVLEAAMALEKGAKEDLPRVLDALEEELIGRLGQARQGKRLFRGVELVRRLRSAARLNVNAGQLAGWLCAGLFLEETEGIPSGDK